jgi:methionyl-tRNA formyltransferase
LFLFCVNLQNLWFLLSFSVLSLCFCDSLVFRTTITMTKASELRLVMMGTGTFAEPTFQTLLDARLNVVGLVTQPDKEIGEKRGSTRQTGVGMKAIAESHRIPVYQPESVNTPEGVAQLQQWQPDLLVVAAYGQILSRDVLATAAHGGINIHASLLPRYRGAAPVAWAIYHGETQTGVTIIKMSIYLDAGEMLAVGKVDIGPDETAGELEARLAPLGGELALQVIEQIATGTTQGIKQDQSQVTKAPKLKKENGLIDWNRPARDVCNQIRAMQPWPTPYTFLHKQGKPPLRVIVARAAVAAESQADGSPGQVIIAPDAASRLLVAAGGQSAVEILEIQPAGKIRMPAVDFLRGHKFQTGDFFGPEAV